MRDFSQLLQIITPAPKIKLLEVTSHADDLSEALAKYLIDVEGDFHLALYPGEHTVPQYDFVKSHTPKDYKSPFRALPREYAAVIMTDILHEHAFAERILKIAYTSLLNASEIIIVQNKTTMSTDEIEALLEKLDFRAGNSIDIFDDYHVVVGKKMHMWGNGL